MIGSNFFKGALELVWVFTFYNDSVIFVVDVVAGDDCDGRDERDDQDPVHRSGRLRCQDKLSLVKLRFSLLVRTCEPQMLANLNLSSTEIEAKTSSFSYRSFSHTFSPSHTHSLSHSVFLNFFLSFPLYATDQN